MAFGTNSKVFAYSVLAVGQNGVKYSSDGYNVALYGNSGTPDNTVTTAALTTYGSTGSQWITGNEVSGTGYNVGGASVSPTQWTQTSNIVTFGSTGTPQWTSASFTSYGCLVYDNTQTKVGLCFNAFGGPQTVTSGTFTITWFSGNQIASFTC